MSKPFDEWIVQIKVRTRSDGPKADRFIAKHLAQQVVRSAAHQTLVFYRSEAMAGATIEGVREAADRRKTKDRRDG